MAEISVSSNVLLCGVLLVSPLYNSSAILINLLNISQHGAIMAGHNRALNTTLLILSAITMVSLG